MATPKSVTVIQTFHVRSRATVERELDADGSIMHEEVVHERVIECEINFEEEDSEGEAEEA